MGLRAPEILVDQPQGQKTDVRAPDLLIDPLQGQEQVSEPLNLS